MIRELQSAPPHLSRFIIYGVTFDAVQSLYRPFSTMYLERLGADSWQFFLLNSLPALFSALALFPSLILVKRLRNERTATTLFFAVSRLFLVSFILVPLLPEGIRPLAFVILFALAAMPEAAGLSGLQSYTGHIFSPDQRSRAIALRSRFGIPLVLALTVGTGFLLRFGPESDSWRLFFYQGMFALAFIGGLVELWFFRRIKGPAPQGDQHLSVREGITSLRSNKAFLLFMAASLTFHFGWQLGWPLFSVYHVKSLGADEAWFAIFNVVSAVTMFFSYGFWDRLQRKYGLALALVTCTLGQALNPFFIGSATALWMQAFFNIFTGFFTAGVVSVFLSGLLTVTPDSKLRIVYLAVYNTLIYVSQVVSQQLGHGLYDLVGIRNAIYLDGGFRLVGTLAFVAFGLWYNRQALGIQPADTPPGARPPGGSPTVPGVALTVQVSATLDRGTESDPPAT